jgi:hypothetical protein
MHSGYFPQQSAAVIMAAKVMYSRPIIVAAKTAIESDVSSCGGSEQTKP